MSLRDTHGKSPDTTKCQSSGTFDACRDRILNVAPPMKFQDNDGKVFTLADLWKAVFEQPVGSDKGRHLEKTVALACLLGPVRFRRCRPDCHDRECLEPATVTYGGRCYCGMHLPAGASGRELWPPRTLAQLQEDIGGGVCLSQYTPGRARTREVGEKELENTDMSEVLRMLAEGGPELAAQLAEAARAGGGGAEAAPAVPPSGEPGCASVEETCKRLGLVCGWDAVIDSGLVQDTVSNGGELPTAQQAVLGPARASGLFLALLDGDGARFRAKRASLTPSVVVPATARQVGAVTEWKELGSRVAFAGAEAVERAAFGEAQTAHLVALALELGGVYAFTDGLFGVGKADLLGVHRVMARWLSLVTSAADALRGLAGLRNLTRSEDYDLPLPGEADLLPSAPKGGGAAGGIRAALLTGRERFALYNTYTPQQRLCAFMTDHEFPRRGWRVRGDSVYVHVRARPRVLVRARVCLRCMRRRCRPGCGGGASPELSPRWHHVCAACGLAREAHAGAAHAFDPVAEDAGEPVGLGAYEPLRVGGAARRHASVLDAVGLAAYEDQRMKAVVIGNPHILACAAKQLRSGPHDRFLEVENDHLRTGNGIFVKHDPLAGPRHYSHLCRCPDDFGAEAASAEGARYRVCFLHDPATFGGGGCAGDSLGSEPAARSSPLVFHTLVRANPPRPDDGPAPPVRVYGHAAPGRLPYRTMVPVRLGGRAEPVDYYVARDQSRGARRVVTVRFSEAELREGLRARPEAALADALREAAEREAALRGGPTERYLGRMVQQGGRTATVAFPQCVLRQCSNKTHEWCVRGLPRRLRPGVAISRMNVTVAARGGGGGDDEEVRRVVCWDQEYNDFVFEGEQTPGYRSDRQAFDPDGRPIPPTRRHGRCTGDNGACAHCGAALSEGQLGGAEDLPVCPSRRFGWRCTPFAVRENAMGRPEPGHCEDFLRIFAAQGYTPSEENSPWRLPPKVQPLCPLFHILMMLGRLFFRLNRLDRHQVALIFIGVGGSGKSLVQKVLKIMSGHGNTYQLPCNEQETFGPLLEVERLREEMGRDHLLLLASEMGRQEPNRFKLMIEGADLTENIKNQNALKRIERFPNPYMATTNSIPESLCRSASDGQGAILRRLDLVAFNHEVKAVDSLLDVKLAGAVEFVLPLLLRAYHMHTKYRARRDFWRGVVPQVIRDRASPFTDALNLLKVFTQRGDFVLDPTAYMPYSDFVNLYTSWCKKENRGHGEAWSDTRCLSWLRSRGMKVKDRYSCLYPPPGADRKAVERYREDGGGGGGGSDKPVVGKFILGIGPANFFPSADEAEGQESSSHLQPGGGRAAAEAFLRCCPPEVASEVIQEILRSREGELPAALGGGIMTIKC